MNKKQLTITGSFTANNKIYDGVTTATILNNSLLLSGIEGSEVVSLTSIVLDFSNKNVANGKTVNITNAGLTGTNSGNYTLSLAGAPTTTAGITAKPLSITADNQSVPYGTTAATVTGAGTYTPSGFVGGENSPVISGSVSYTTTYTASTAPATSGVTITPDVTGLTAINYSFTPVDGTITIVQASSTIVVTGSTNFTFTGSAQGPNSSTVTGSSGTVTYSYSGTGATSYGPSTTQPTNVGTYQVVATVAADANYNAASSLATAFTITSPIYTWEGTTSSDWSTTTNWSPQILPTSQISVNIPVAATIYPVISASTQADCYNLTVESGAALTLESDASNSGSLIVHGTSSSGNVSYNRYMDATRWYIASAPVNVASGFGANASKVHQDASASNAYDFASYSESANDWSYVASNAFPTGLTSGQGYLISLISAGTIQFTGTLNNGNVPIGVSSSSEKGWNAVGNPYTSAIGVTSSAATTENFLTKNAGILNPDYAAIYVWNETSSGYDGTQQYYRVIGNSNYIPASGAFATLSDNYIQAGQGFLIHSNASSTATFTKAMQSHQTGLDLKSAEVSWPGITLLAESNGQTRSTVVAFNEAMTTGLDVTYDAGLLASDNFQVYTHLVSSNNPVDFAIQCLPDHQYSQLRVPIGVDLPDGGELVFKASGIILPVGIYPIIEDKVLGTQTALKTETDTYKVTLDKNTTGIGRFYLSMGGDMALSTIKPKTEILYTANLVDNHIVLNGIVESGTKAILFDICGRKLAEYKLENTNRNEISVSGMNQKVYLLKVEGKNTSQIIKLLAIKY